jgi:hypothetical protein
MDMVVDRGEFYNMLLQLDAFYRAPDGLQRPEGLAFADPIRADLEGVTAWGFDVYLNRRENGATPEQAWHEVERQIRQSDEWKSKHPAPEPEPGDWPTVPTFTPAPRGYRGDMCGSDLDGLPLLPGTRDPRLVLSWFYDRYLDPSDRQRVREHWRGNQYTDTFRSWPDAREFGLTPQEFIGTVCEQVREGDQVTVALLSDEIDPHHDVPELIARVNVIAPGILASRAVGRVVISFEMDALVTPDEAVEIIRAVAPQFVHAGIKVYVHYSPHAFSMLANPPSEYTQNQVFYNKVVGLVTGIMAQADAGWTQPRLLDWINDCLERCAGHDNMPAVMIDDPIDGPHGLDFILLENGASERFDGTLSESDCRLRGRWAMEAPHRTGPAGEARVMGVGNGYR